MKNFLLLFLTSYLLLHENSIVAQQITIHANVVDTNQQKINGNYILVDTLDNFIQGNIL